MGKCIHSAQDAPSPRAHGPGGAHGGGVAHDAPHVRARAVGGAARRAAGVARQRALGARRHEVRGGRADRVRHSEPEGVEYLPTGFYITCTSNYSREICPYLHFVCWILK